MKKKPTKPRAIKAWAVCDKNGEPYTGAIYLTRIFAVHDAEIYARSELVSVKRVEIRVIGK